MHLQAKFGGLGKSHFGENLLWNFAIHNAQAWPKQRFFKAPSLFIEKKIAPHIHSSKKLAIALSLIAMNEKYFFERNFYRDFEKFHSFILCPQRSLRACAHIASVSVSETLIRHFDFSARSFETAQDRDEETVNEAISSWFRGDLLSKYWWFNTSNYHSLSLSDKLEFRQRFGPKQLESPLMAWRWLTSWFLMMPD